MDSLAARLVAEMDDRGHWRGELSSSALSTATAVCALELYRRDLDSDGGRPAAPAPALEAAVRAGAGWLCGTQNSDGGWGDTVDSPSNISTTALSWAALGLLATEPRGVPGRADDWPRGVPDPADDGLRGVLDRADDWLRDAAGDLSPAAVRTAITQRYGDDRTFSAPILTMCALAGRLGEPGRAWAHVPALPFELAALPRSWFRLLGLPTVSYALPALIAIGQARHHHHPGRNPLARLARGLARRRTLERLGAIQPPNGGFLEATPLTAFVTMSLVSTGESNHRVVRRGVGFLLDSMRDDGSWPVDTDLATWVTTSAIEALAAGGRLQRHVGADALERLGAWLLGQQLRDVHPYTGARPGGWAWTDLPGGVPDADDTAGALIALRRLADAGAVDRAEALEAADLGVRWLVGLQNRDGGIPTFCRGWGKLPFDRSGADLTAHALRAWDAWRPAMPRATRRRLRAAAQRAVRFLIDAQRPDGAWVPLWFGNQDEPREENPVYGTARVLLAREVEVGGGGIQGDADGIEGDAGGIEGDAGAIEGNGGRERARRRRPAGALDLGQSWEEALGRGRRWLLGAQNPDGGWGGGPSLPSTVEETALAATALAACDRHERTVIRQGEEARARALGWLADRTGGSELPAPAPIGLYFAKLWYSERLYPLIFATGAVESASSRRGDGAVWNHVPDEASARGLSSKDRSSKDRSSKDRSAGGEGHEPRLGVGP